MLYAIIACYAPMCTNHNHNMHVIIKCFILSNSRAQCLTHTRHRYQRAHCPGIQPQQPPIIGRRTAAPLPVSGITICPKFRLAACKHRRHRRHKSPCTIWTRGHASALPVYQRMSQLPRLRWWSNAKALYDYRNHTGSVIRPCELFNRIISYLFNVYTQHPVDRARYPQSSDSMQLVNVAIIQ